MATVNDAASSRKRMRSASASSSTSGTSKRAASDSPRPPVQHSPNPPGPSSSLAQEDKEIDEYMRTQGEGLSLSDSINPNDESTQPATSSASPTPNDKLAKIQSLKNKALALGDIWYLVSRPWYRGWESACGGAPWKGAPETEDQVKAIDNSSLAGSKPGKLKPAAITEG
ncbi:CSN-associated deubiquitinating enzyme Ubp12, partial [Tulasnella sp. 427]